LEHHVRLAKQARYKLKLETQHQVSHCTNQVVDAEINAAAKHHVEAKEAFISKIEEDHHQENGLKVAIDPDQETEAEETATDVETCIRGPVQQSTRSARIVRRVVTTREPAELVNPSRPDQASQHRWLNKSKLHLRLIEAEVRHQVLQDQQKFSQSTTHKNWSLFKWRLRFATEKDDKLRHCQTRAPTSWHSSQKSYQSWACQTKT
jgi:hypothetical protein